MDASTQRPPSRDTGTARALRAVTPVGWAVAVATLVGALLAWRAGWAEGAVVALFGLVCLLVAGLGLLRRPAFEVAIDLPQPRTRVGAPVFGSVVVTNRRSGRSPGAVVEVPVGDGVLPVHVPALAAGASRTETFLVPAERRGVVVLGPARAVRGDALGLVQVVRAWTDPVELYVHPETVRVPFDATGFQADVEGVTTARLSSSDVSFHALRDYAPGDDRRHVHWPTTARTGRLVVRHYEETRRSHHVIVLDTSADAWRDAADAFELAVSATASLALAGVSLSRRVTVLTSAGRVTTSGPVRLLDRCAGLAADAPDVPLAGVVRRALATHRSTSALTIVCGPRASDADLARWSRLAPVDVQVGVVRADPGRTASRRTTARALVVDCPTLADLPRLVAAAGVRR